MTVGSHVNVACGPDAGRARPHEKPSTMSGQEPLVVPAMLNQPRPYTTNPVIHEACHRRVSEGKEEVSPDWNVAFTHVFPNIKEPWALEHYKGHRIGCCNDELRLWTAHRGHASIPQTKVATTDGATLA